ncbi:MAG: flagellar hook-length control protein FliK [Oscillospiraceae bacterium]|jgi:flagellar hook-length control protein FliK
MISISPAEAISVALPETEISIASEEGASFSDLFSAIAEEAAAGQAAAAESDDDLSDDKTAESVLTALFQQLLSLMGMTERSAGTSENEEITPAVETFTGVLEGNGVSGDTDIAALQATAQSIFESLGSEERETIMARMPQIRKLFQETGNAAQGEPGGNLCPLENSSEQVRAVAQALAQALAEEPQVVLNEASRSLNIPENDKIEVSYSKPAAGETLQAAVTADAEDLAQPGAAGAECKASESAGMEKEETDPKREENADLTPKLLSGFGISREAAAPDKPAGSVIKAAVSTAFSEITDFLSHFHEESGGRLEIQLEPESLGKLTISITRGEGGLKALIRTKDSRVHELLSGEIGALADKLGEKGVELRSLDVICSDPGPGQFGSESFGGSDRGRGYGSGWKRPDKVQAAYESSNITKIFDWSYEDVIGSTVSYSA